jgi:hypothetical protein
VPFPFQRQFNFRIQIRATECEHTVSSGFQSALPLLGLIPFYWI